MEFTEKEIGKEAIAQIGENLSRVQYSDSNDGEPQYYRDVYLKGILIYCEGESCKVKSYDNENQIVTLTNENNNVLDFTIPYEQYLEDF